MALSIEKPAVPGALVCWPSPDCVPRPPTPCPRGTGGVPVPAAPGSSPKPPGPAACPELPRAPLGPGAAPGCSGSQCPLVTAGTAAGNRHPRPRGPGSLGWGWGQTRPAGEQNFSSSNSTFGEHPVPPCPRQGHLSQAGLLQPRGAPTAPPAPHRLPHKAFPAFIQSKRTLFQLKTVPPSSVSTAPAESLSLSLFQDPLSTTRMPDGFLQAGWPQISQPFPTGQVLPASSSSGSSRIALSQTHLPLAEHPVLHGRRALSASFGFG